MALINELIGNFGLYHLGLCIMIFLSKFGIAFHQMAIIFLAPPADYQCPDTNNSCCDKPVFNTSVFTRTIVTEWNLICQDSWYKDLTQTLFQFGVLIGSLLLGISSDKYGRRPTLIFAVVLEVLTGIISSFLPDFWSFTFMRTLLGFSVGGVMIIGFVIIMEFVGNIHRDVVSALFHVPFTLGHIILALFGFLIRDYMYFQLIISTSTTVLLIYICLLPESPRWLMATNNTVKAIALMERVAKINHLPTEEIRNRIELYQMESIRARDKKGSVIDLFRTPNIRKNLLVMSFLWVVCSYCFYGMAHYISHLTGDVYINVMASGCVCLCACFIAIPVMKFLKRKTVVIICNLCSSLCFFVIIFITEGKWSTVLGCFGLLFNYMVFIVIYLYCSEMFPTVVRNGAIGITSMMARAGSMIAPFVAGLRPFGKWCAPVAFGVFPLIAALLCFLLPETKDCELMMSIEEGEAFGKKPPRRQNLDFINEVT